MGVSRKKKAELVFIQPVSLNQRGTLHGIADAFGTTPPPKLQIILKVWKLSSHPSIVKSTITEYNM